MSKLTDRIAWVTGAGSGIGEATAIALAREGAVVVLSGRRAAPITALAARITAAGGMAHAQPADMTVATEVAAVAAFIRARFGRLDILVANAGVNILERQWAKLGPDGADAVIRGNLNSAFYCASAALPLMRADSAGGAGRGGCMIFTASMAGRFISLLSGPAYTAAKHGVVAMVHTLNMEECVNGIRASAVLPGEVATPILDQRPVPVSPEERARMAQPGDVADLILYIAALPPHVTINEVMITPSWNRGYVAALRRQG